MNVLLLGGRGFLGRHVAAALEAQGHTVITEGEGQGGGALDLGRLLTPGQWAPWLAGVDAVVNAAGVLRDTRRRPIWSTHAWGPSALFQACADMGVRRVVQLSALGVEGNDTAYAASKRVADEALLALGQRGLLDAMVLRPSVVVGAGGASTALFLALARLPWLLLPEPVARGLAQPVHVNDVAAAVAVCLQPGAASRGAQGVLALAGPQVFSLQDWVAHWREALGRRPARVVQLPPRLSRWSARVGDVVPVTPWCSETLALLEQPNTADEAVLRGLLGRAAVSVRDWPNQEVSCAQPTPV